MKGQHLLSLPEINPYPLLSLKGGRRKGARSQFKAESVPDI